MRSHTCPGPMVMIASSPLACSSALSDRQELFKIYKVIRYKDWALREFLLQGGSLQWSACFVGDLAAGRRQLFREVVEILMGRPMMRFRRRKQMKGQAVQKMLSVIGYIIQCEAVTGLFSQPGCVEGIRYLGWSRLALTMWTFLCLQISNWKTPWTQYQERQNLFLICTPVLWSRRIEVNCGDQRTWLCHIVLGLIPGPVQIRHLPASVRCSRRQDMFCFSICERWSVRNEECPCIRWPVGSFARLDEDGCQGNIAARLPQILCSNYSPDRDSHLNTWGFHIPGAFDRQGRCRKYSRWIRCLVGIGFQVCPWACADHSSTEP